jgi:type IV secretion system protein VirD4
MSCGLLGAVGVRLWTRTTSPASTAFGSARWATPQEVQRAGLFAAGNSILLGTLDSRYIRHNGPQHVLVFSPTRSGKTVGVVIPTLLTYSGSVVVTDIKGEVWATTAGYRKQHSYCIYFNPTDVHSARYNPLLEVRQGPNEVRDVQNIADILVDPEGSLERRDHWQATSHALLVGALLHVLYAEPDKTLSGMATFLSDPKRSITETIHVMMHTQHLGNRVHPAVASAARELLNKSPNELSGVLSTAMSFLGLYRDPLIAQTTSASDWRWQDLQHAKVPISLYLVIPPSDLSRTRPLLRLLLNQMGRVLTEDAQTPRAHTLLLMLDEFPALGRLDFFESELAYLAGYGIRAVLVAQSLNQLDKAYGAHHSLLDNCHVRLAMAANDDRTAQRISALLGQQTQQRTQHSLSGNRAALWYDKASVSVMESGRPLLTPGEVMQLPDDEVLVLVAGEPPIRAQKLRYFTDQTLLARVRPAPHVRGSDAPASLENPWLAEGPKTLVEG